MSIDQNLKSEIQDIVKQLKANGSFDQFRKDCFGEIIAQPRFNELTKSLEDFVFKFLREQKQNVKKNLIRENLRQSLNE
jgi:hypothetical protein